MEINLDITTESSFDIDITEKQDNKKVDNNKDNYSDSELRKIEKKKFEKICPDYPYQPMIIPAQRRIVAIGDIHGDLDLAIESLKLAKVVDNDLNWIGKDTVVVQIGDQVDSCRPLPNKTCDQKGTTVNDKAEDLKVLNFFTELHNKALKDGGSVYSLLGNHELMNSLGNINYASYENLYNDPEVKQYKKENSMEDESMEAVRKHMFKPGNKYGNFMGCSRLSAVIIGSFLFVHAGIIKRYTDEIDIKNRKDLMKLNHKVRKWLLGLINKDYVDKIVTSFKYSLFWDRVLGGIPPNMNNNDPRCEEHLKDVLELFNIGKMVIGHTPQFFENNEGINKTCGDALWRVDIGGSTAFSNFDSEFTKNKKVMDLRKVQVLEILDDKEMNILK